MHPNRRFLPLFPKITVDEYTFLEPYLERLTEEQAKDFLRIYNESRLDPQMFVLLAALGFVFTPGIQRFYIGHWGMGLLYMFTCGLFWIGNIYDLVTGKDKVLEVNREKAWAVFSNFGNPYDVNTAF